MGHLLAHGQASFSNASACRKYRRIVFPTPARTQPMGLYFGLGGNKYASATAGSPHGYCQADHRVKPQKKASHIRVFIRNLQVKWVMQQAQPAQALALPNAHAARRDKIATARHNTFPRARAFNQHANLGLMLRESAASSRACSRVYTSCKGKRLVVKRVNALIWLGFKL